MPWILQGFFFQKTKRKIFKILKIFFQVVFKIKSWVLKRKPKILFFKFLKWVFLILKLYFKIQKKIFEYLIENFPWHLKIYFRNEHFLKFKVEIFDFFPEDRTPINLKQTN